MRRCKPNADLLSSIPVWLVPGLGCYLIATRGTDAKRKRLQRRLTEALIHSANTEDVEVILARNELMSEIPFVNRFLVQLQAALHLKRMLDQADIHITPSRLGMFSVMAGMLGLLAASVLTISILVIAASGLMAAMIPFVHVWWKRRQRFNAFLEHLPDALDLMSRGSALVMLSPNHCIWLRARCRAHRHGVSQDLRGTKPGSLAQVGPRKYDGAHAVVGLEDVRHGGPDSARDRRQPGRDSRKGCNYDSRTLPHYGRLKNVNNQFAHVGVAVMRITNLRDVHNHGDESRLHECALERSARSLPNRSRAVSANHRNADCEEDTSTLRFENGLGFGLWPLTADPNDA